MEKRFQIINGDPTLDITEDTQAKRRLSEKTLTRQKKYLEDAIVKFQASLAKVNEGLAAITTAKNEAKG